MTEFRDIISIENGAQFVDVDLHIHSYGGSSDVSDPNMTPSKIVDSAVSQGLRVISITDHNTDCNVQKAISYANETYAGEILVVAGVEVTTSHGHLLAYFAPDRVSDLAKFLVKLDLRGEPGADGTHTAMSMADVIGQADALGGICIAAHVDRTRTGFEVFAPGFQNWKKDILTSPGLYGLESDSDEALEWYSPHDQSSAAAERQKLLDARGNIPGLRSRKDLAHLRGSDSHSLAGFEQKSPTKPWTRMKLTELSFHAFRVALIDPTARVVAKSILPETVPHVKGIAFTGGFLNGELIQFSPNLNCFIGGRGTGKSTAIRSLSFALGIKDDFADYENCPDAVTVWCEGANGVIYRYDRMRNGSLTVRAKEDESIHGVPPDSFHIEYFGQGELSEVAKDPLNHPELFQDFLDRHTDLRDLQDQEAALSPRLRQNAARLAPLEIAAGQLPEKKRKLADIEKKLRLAEEGNLREVVSQQSKLAAEKAIRESIDAIVTEFSSGYSLAIARKDFEKIVETAGDTTSDAESAAAISDIRQLIESSNQKVSAVERELREHLRAVAQHLGKQALVLKGAHQRLSADVATTLANLKDRGLATTIPGLEAVLREKTALVREINSIEQRAAELTEVRAQRGELLEELDTIRKAITARRKALLAKVNRSLSVLIEDYLVFVRYDDVGITAPFEAFVQEAMTGSYLQDESIGRICNSISPLQLSRLIVSGNPTPIEKQLGLSSGWGDKMIQRLSEWPVLFKLQELAKPPKPVIVVRTRSTPPVNVPVKQLSDGQRHTILLTIAMLSDSNVPLVIDQPEDDLDNAFIFKTVVSTLRSVKERRQVIVVTHNPNIAVLGDSELILPMYRTSNTGKAESRGSIDSEATRGSVVDILEGGHGAFLRRKELYGH